MADSKLKYAVLKEQIQVNLKVADINTKEGPWSNPHIYVKFPEGTKFEIKGEDDLQRRVEIDFDDFILGFSIRKSVFKK